ncbi:MAG: hypothetical protein ACFFEV_00775 [Candidatus Thorarchaeota archaeon]
MIADKDSTRLWVTLERDGDIRLNMGGTQKLLTVDVHSLVRNRSTTVHCSKINHKKKQWSRWLDMNQETYEIELLANYDGGGLE